MKQAAALALCAILSSALTVNGQETSGDATLGWALDAINQRLDNADKRVDRRFEDADNRIDQRFEDVNQRLDAIDKRLRSIETRLNEVESTANNASGQLSVVKWFFMALIGLGCLFAGVYVALRMLVSFAERR